MKVGDLVRGPKRGATSLIGLIVEMEHTFTAGGGGAWPSSETWAHVLWNDGTRFKYLRSALEVINESR